MNNKLFFAALLFFCWVFSSCGSFIDIRKMNLDTNNTSGKILNLKYAGDADEILSATAEKMVRNGFLNRQGEEYGYYDVRYEVTTRTSQGSFVRNLMLSLPILPILGVPTGSSQFSLTAHFYVFDSNGSVVKHYSNSNNYNQVFGLYYNGGYATKRGAKEFSKLFNAIFDKAAEDSSAINEALREAGPVSGNRDIAQVQANIDRFFRENPYAQNSK